jgi:hypothetical protein
MVIVGCSAACYQNNVSLITHINSASVGTAARPYAMVFSTAVAAIALIRLRMNEMAGRAPPRRERAGNTRAQAGC